MRFFKSFKYAFRGFIYCVNNERNMRIHTAAAVYVFAFSFFFGLSRTQYAVLFLTFSSVIAAELLNTVAEELSDMAAASFNPVVRIVKDMASGAVLVCAGFAAAIGICLFWRPEKFAGIAGFFVSRPAMLAAFVFFSVITGIYIVMGPIGIRDFIRKKKRRNKEENGWTIHKN